MNNYGIIALLILIVALFAAGCTTDSGGIDPGQLTGDVTNGLTGALTSDTSDEWVLWNVDDTEIDLTNGSYSLFRPNLNGVLFRHLKVEIELDDGTQAGFRVVNETQAQEYVKNWEDYYIHKTSPSFDPNAAGYISFSLESGPGIGTGEMNGEEGMILILESVDWMPDKGVMDGIPGKGTIKIYYPK